MLSPDQINQLLLDFIQLGTEEIKFKYCSIAPYEKNGDLWYVFDKPQNSFPWFHYKLGEHFTSSMKLRKENCMSFSDAVKFVQEYTVFCENSEQF